MNIVIWALLTSGITGGAWVAIVLLQRQKCLAAQNRELLDDRQRTLDELEALSDRMIELEDRLGFAERELGRSREAARLAPAPPLDR